MRRAARVALAAAALPAAALAQEVTVLPQVQVVGTAPLPGFTTPLSQIPYNVQPFTARMLAQPTTGIAEFLDALQKLYYGRDMNTLTVFSVVLNPIS